MVGKMRSTQLSPQMGTIIDATNPEVFVAAITAKYAFIKAQQDVPLLYPPVSYGGAFDRVFPPKAILDTPSIYEGEGFLLSTYQYVFDESERRPITKDTVIPKPGTRYCPAYFRDRFVTPVYSVVIRPPEMVRAFRKPTAILEKPYAWNPEETPEEDWF